MTKTERRNLSYVGTVEGILDMSGQAYNRVTVTGELAVKGTLDCNELVVIGTFGDDGKLKAKKVKINGEMDVKGDLSSDLLKVNGQIEVGGTAIVKKLYIRGTTVVRDCVVSDRIDLIGDIIVKNDCNAETFVSRGAFDIGGLLNASNIDIRLFGPCRVKEIGGETISIRRTLIDRVLKLLMPRRGFSGDLVADTIEGDNIYVEYTSAKTVRGNRVKIGKGCDIGLVEYKNSFEQDKSAQIKEHVKTGI